MANISDNCFLTRVFRYIVKLRTASIFYTHFMSYLREKRLSRLFAYYWFTLFLAVVFAFAILALAVEYDNTIYLALIPSLLMFLWAALRMIPYAASAHWKHAVGQLVSLTEQCKRVNRDISGSFASYFYFPIVKYSYVVDGQCYESEKPTHYQTDLWIREIIRDDGIRDTIEPKPWLNWLEQGQVPVYYDPRYPKYAVIVNRASRVTKGGTGFVLLLATLLLLLWLVLMMTL